MKDFFVEQIMSGFLITALPVAFVAGVISFLSPCERLFLPKGPKPSAFAALSSEHEGLSASTLVTAFEPVDGSIQILLHT